MGHSVSLNVIFYDELIGRNVEELIALIRIMLPRNDDAEAPFSGVHGILNAAALEVIVVDSHRKDILPLLIHQNRIIGSKKKLDLLPLLQTGSLFRKGCRSEEGATG